MAKYRARSYICNDIEHRYRPWCLATDFRPASHPSPRDLARVASSASRPAKTQRVGPSPLSPCSQMQPARSPPASGTHNSWNRSSNNSANLSSHHQSLYLHRPLPRQVSCQFQPSFPSLSFLCEQSRPRFHHVWAQIPRSGEALHAFPAGDPVARDEGVYTLPQCCKLLETHWLTVRAGSLPTEANSEWKFEVYMV